MTSTAPTVYSLSLHGDVTVVRFGSRTLVDPLAMRELATSLKTLVKQDDFHGLLLNLEGVTFVASAFLNVVLTIEREVPAARKPIRVCCPSASVRETFELTRLHTKFPLFDDQESALLAFA